MINKLTQAKNTQVFGIRNEFISFNNILQNKMLNIFYINFSVHEDKFEYNQIQFFHLIVQIVFHTIAMH